MLTTFGLMPEVDEFLVRDWISQLVTQNLLKVEGDPAVLRLGVPVNRLRSLPPVLLLEPTGRAAAGSADAAWAGVDREAARRVAASAARWPDTRGCRPTWFSATWPCEMARSRPVRQEQLAALYGVGEIKARNLGGPFLQAIAARWAPAEASRRKSSHQRKEEKRARAAEKAARGDGQQHAVFLNAVIDRPDDDKPARGLCRVAPATR